MEGGPWTRKDPATGKLSCLDLFIASRELVPYINKLVIDKELKMTPARTIKNKGKVNICYTDHFAILLTLKDLPRKQEKRQEKQVMWNLAKENGWEAYTKLTDEYSVKLEEVIEDKTLNIPDIMKKFENIHNSKKIK